MASDVIMDAELGIDADFAMETVISLDALDEVMDLIEMDEKEMDEETETPHHLLVFGVILTKMVSAGRVVMSPMFWQL